MAIVIDVKLGKSDKALASFDAMYRKFKQIDRVIEGWAAKFEKAAESAERLAKAVATISPQNFRSGGSGGGRKSAGIQPHMPQFDFGSPAGKKTASLYDQFRFADRLNRISGGQYQQQRDDLLRRAYMHYGQLAKSGDPTGVRVLTQLLKPYHDMTNPKTPWQRVMQAVMTTRFNIGKNGVGVSPLIGRTLAALSGAGGAAGAAGAAGGAGLAGVGAVAGPVALAVAAIIGFTKATLWAGEQLKEMAGDLVTGGGSAYESSVARGIGQATGLGPNAAAQFQQRISGGVGAGFAAGIGINPIGGPFGDINYNAKLIKAAEAIMRAPNLEAARRLAEGLGTPELANLKMYSKSTQQDILKRFGGGASQAEMASGMELSYWTGRLTDQFMVLAARILMPAIKTLTVFFEWIQKIIAALEVMYRLLYPFGGSGGQSSNPVKENTQAIEENTRAIKEMRETMGGGQRAARALPNRLNGLNLSDDAVRRGLAGGMVV